MKVHEEDRYGSNYWKSLKLHYEGKLIYANNISKAKVELKNLFYSGENKPHMWCVGFEWRLNWKFQTNVKHEVRVLHLNKIKLQTLL